MIMLNSNGVEGQIYDVIVNLKKRSKYYLKHYVFTLDGKKRLFVYSKRLCSRIPNVNLTQSFIYSF